MSWCPHRRGLVSVYLWRLYCGACEGVRLLLCGCCHVDCVRVSVCSHRACPAAPALLETLAICTSEATVTARRATEVVVLSPLSF